MNARGAGSCDQAVRPRYGRGVGDGDEEQRATESVGEQDVEMHGGPEEEIMETRVVQELVSPMHAGTRTGA